MGCSVGFTLGSACVGGVGGSSDGWGIYAVSVVAGVLDTGGDKGIALLRMTATFFIVPRVSSVMVRHGAGGWGVLRMARMSCAVLRRRSLVET